MSNAVLVTGGFDPLHSGHINYFNNAKKLGDKLIVGLNSDDWLSRKKGQPFMNLENRASIIVELGMVDEVIIFNDSCLLYTSPSPRDTERSRMPSSA